MAISAKSVGTWAASNATTQTVTLPTHAAGDMLIVRAGCKPYTATPTISTSGWTAVGTAYANGVTVNGNGTGSVIVRAWYKEATSSSETNPVVDWGTTSAPGGAVAVCYQKGAGESWVAPTGAGGGDDTARTSQTATIGTNISVTAGDMVDFFVVTRDDSAVTVATITQTGVTFDTVVEYPGTALASATSNDGAYDGGYRLASSGTSSAAAVVTHTNAVTESGAAWQTRLRVTAAAVDVAGSLAVSSSASTADTGIYWEENAEGTDGVTVTSSNSSLTDFPVPASKLTFETTASIPEGSSYFRMSTAAATGQGGRDFTRAVDKKSYFRFYYRNSAPTSATDFWRLFDNVGAVPRVRLDLNGSGQINMRDRDTTRGTTTKALSSGEWCRIEVLLDETVDQMTFRMWWGADLHSASTGATNYETMGPLTWTPNAYDEHRFGNIVSVTADGDFDAIAHLINGTNWIGPRPGGTTHSADGSLAVAASNAAAGTAVNDVAGSLAVSHTGTAAGTAVNEGTATLAVTLGNTASATVVNEIAGSLAVAAAVTADAAVVNDIIGSQTYAQSFTATATVERSTSGSLAVASTGSAVSASVTDVATTPLAITVGLSAAATVQNDVSGAVAINTSGTAAATVVNDVASTNLAVAVVGAGTSQREANGTASQSYASAGTAASSADRAAQGSLAVTVSSAAAATVVRAGSASLAVSHAGSSAATVVNEVAGSLAAAHTSSATAEIDGQLSGLLQVSSTGTAATSAIREATGSLSVALSNTAAASITNEAQASLPVGTTGTAVGSILNEEDADLLVASSGTAAASVTNDAQASGPITVVSTAVATVVRSGSASLAVASAGTAATSAVRSGSASLTVVTVLAGSATKVLVTSGALPVAYAGSAAPSADRQASGSLVVASSSTAVAVNPSSTPTIGQLWPRGGG